MSAHLVILPILLPLTAAAVLLLLGGKRRRLYEAIVAVAANVALLALVVTLAVMVDAAPQAGVSTTYRLGNWPTSVAIVLVADRLSALMLIVAATLGLMNTLASLGRWSRLGPYYLALSQLLLMGLNGAFLTGDLFNLFVFFEILLCASYGLLLHGSGARRVAVGLHYIVINLAASLLFLIGVSVIFGVTGTLNMAALADRIPDLTDRTRSLAHAGAAVLGVAFLVKAAAWPLGFWMPRTYDAAIPPAAAMFAIMTKVGVYAVIRLGLLLFGPDAGRSAGFGTEALFLAGAVTMCVGMAGMLAARDLGRLTGYGLMVSAGTLLGVFVFADAAALAGGLFYLVVSTFGAAALYLLGSLIGPEDGGDRFTGPTALEVYDSEAEHMFTEEDEHPVLIPAPVGILSAGFLVCTLIIAGLPPLPGFLAKVAMLAPLVQDLPGPFPSAAPIMATLIIVSSLLALVALARAGIQIWWADAGRIPPTMRISEVAPVAALLFVCLVLTFAVEGPFSFMRRTADQVLDPAQYVHAVLGAETAQ